MYKIAMGVDTPGEINREGQRGRKEIRAGDASSKLRLWSASMWGSPSLMMTVVVRLEREFIVYAVSKHPSGSRNPSATRKAIRACVHSAHLR